MKSYTSDIRKFVTSQYIYSGVRISLACVIPAVILGYFGLLKEYSLFPLATSFIGLTDMPGPFVRRINTLLFSVACFFVVSIIAISARHHVLFIYLIITVFGVFFTMIGVYGQRLASVGSISLLVMIIFTEDSFSKDNVWVSILAFSAGNLWYVIIFLIVSKIQPYKLVYQNIGENYLELAALLRIKARFYIQKDEVKKLFDLAISKQIEIKNKQETTQEVVFKTRKIVNEATTKSRLLMMMYLSSLDLHEMLIASENHYKKIQKGFSDTGFLLKIYDFLVLLSDEISHIGLSLQAGTKAKPLYDISEKYIKLYSQYCDMRSRRLNSSNLEDFILLRQSLAHMNQLSQQIIKIYKIFSQDHILTQNNQPNIDYKKFLPKEEKISFSLLKNNFSLESLHFRHAIRVTTALVIGYTLSLLPSLNFGHGYWILITIVAILKPSYSITKSRNLLRLYGTVAGCLVSYMILKWIPNPNILLGILLLSMALSYTFLRDKYMIAVFFMTIYVLLLFNFLNKEENINIIFRDRLIDTFIGGVISYAVSNFVLPVWEHTHKKDFMIKATENNLNYFLIIIRIYKTHEFNEQAYKEARKDTLISLANLSDSFQRMLSDPKTQHNNLEIVHQFVTLSHLITSYNISLSHFAKNTINFAEIDFERWESLISSELKASLQILKEEDLSNTKKEKCYPHLPEDDLEEMIAKRKAEIDENLHETIQDPDTISHLTEVKNIRDILEMIYNTAREQRKIVENLSTKTNLLS
ncbi:MAG: FUSC family protein [Bergeyella sp.]|nr:FUSC family protein [Bergeyella sp.]